MNEWREEGLIGEDEKIEIQRVLRFLWLMWAGCLGTLPALLLVSLTIGRQLREDMMAGRHLPRDVLSIFLILAFGFPVAAYLLRKDLIVGKIKGFKQRTEQVATRTNKPVYLVRYRVGAYLPMVASTAPAICGFGIYVVGGHAVMFFVLLGISVLSMAYHRPKRAEIIAIIRHEKSSDQVS
jgi:hypothetical protein